MDWFTITQYTYSEFPPELYDNTPYLWTLAWSDEDEPTKCADCDNPATWQCQSDEEMPYVDYFCGTCTQEMLRQAPKLEIRECLRTRDGELITWIEASDDGNLEEGWGLWEYSEEYPVLCKEFAPPTG